MTSLSDRLHPPFLPNSADLFNSILGFDQSDGMKASTRLRWPASVMELVPSWIPAVTMETCSH